MLNAPVFANADGEKIQIGEQLDWRVTFERTGGNRSDRASRAAIPVGFRKTKSGPVSVILPSDSHDRLHPHHVILSEAEAVRRAQRSRRTSAFGWRAADSTSRTVRTTPGSFDYVPSRLGSPIHQPPLFPFASSARRRNSAQDDGSFLRGASAARAQISFSSRSLSHCLIMLW